jgi:hypothetical protein
MRTDTDDQTRVREISVDVASCVVCVSGLDRSLKFYCDVFSCHLAIRCARQRHVRRRAPAARLPEEFWEVLFEKALLDSGKETSPRAPALQLEAVVKRLVQVLVGAVFVIGRPLLGL